MGADASHFIDKTVVLTNDHGKNLTCDGSRFSASPNSAAWEHWKLEAADRGADGKVTSVYIHNAAHDIRLSASSDRKTLTASKNRAGWEKWTVQANGDRFNLKSAHGTYLNQGSDGNTLQSNNLGGSELFRISEVGGSTEAKAKPAAPVVPKSPAGRHHVTAHNSHQMQATNDHAVRSSTNKGGWEIFTLETHGDKTVFCGAHGRNLQVDGEGRVQLSPNKGGWEQFTLKPVAGHPGKFIIVAHTGNTLGFDGSNWYCNNRNEGGWEQFAITAAA